MPRLRALRLPPLTKGAMPMSRKTASRFFGPSSASSAMAVHLGRHCSRFAPANREPRISSRSASARTPPMQTCSLALRPKPRRDENARGQLPSTGAGTRMPNMLPPQRRVRQMRNQHNTKQYRTIQNVTKPCRTWQQATTHNKTLQHLRKQRKHREFHRVIPGNPDKHKLQHNLIWNDLIALAFLGSLYLN